MSNAIELLVEAERRGILPPDKVPLLEEARKRGLVPGVDNNVPAATPAEEGWSVKGMVRSAMPVIDPVVKGTAAAVGAAGGTVATGGNPIGGVAGAGVGYATGSKISRGINDWATDAEQKPETPMETLKRSTIETAQDFTTGAAMEAGGQALGAGLPMAMKLIGKVGKPLMGRLTGTGTGSVEEAIASGAQLQAKLNTPAGQTAFQKAMRGEITADDVVDNARAAIVRIRDQRAADYQKALQQFTQGPQKSIDVSPIRRRLFNLMGRYGVKVNPDGSLNMTRTALGKSGNKDVEEIVDIILGWGKQKGDRTPVGLDTLKRQLDDFYSDSSSARQFVANLRDEVNGVLTRSVPEYGKMTKGYADATRLIKDIESGLMLRKQGMTGRITADQTLRRLVSAMKDNNELRRDLVRVLGEQGGVDLTGQVAGHAMSQVLPRGLAGEAPFLIGEVAMAYKLLDPKWWPLLAASSPRVAGEFLQLIGRTAVGLQGKVPTLSRAAVYGAAAFVPGGSK